MIGNCWICKKKLYGNVRLIESWSDSGAMIKTLVCYDCLSKFDNFVILNLIDEKLTELDRLFFKNLKEVF